MANNKIGCQAGKTKIVDPNNFDGMESSSNISVPLEDLNISVKLSTYRRGRTVLSTDGNNNTQESSKTISINFIEGSEINGTKSLTTKYTDLTTVFEAGTVNSETLGITNIDIDFNSSYAPMITIDFVDVRGSSIFQNDSGISDDNAENKFSTFFQLPYPLFELEIKGYYGKPVNYCLHMLKFNSKFNSKTGNFEISCSFIGYTYAMFSDMLVGYLKAIASTKIGIEKYKKYNETRVNNGLGAIDTLDELMKKINNVNQGITKLSETSANSKVLNSIKEGLDKLEQIEALISSLGHSLDIGLNQKEKYPYTVKQSGKLTKEQENAIATYKINIAEALNGVNDGQEGFNTLSLGVTLDLETFKDIESKGVNKGFYSDLTKDMFDPAKASLTDQNKLKEKLNSPDNFEEFKLNIFKYLKDYNISDTLSIDIYMFKLLYEKVAIVRQQIVLENKNTKKNLALELKNEVAENLGFDPTVRNIIEIFTAAIEVFMETIHDVSLAAENDDNIARHNELEVKFGENILTSDMNAEKLKTKKYYAWPDYREKDEELEAYVDKYLGEEGVLTQPDNVNELVFIDDLLKAFIKSAQNTEEVLNDVETGEKTWFPINPLDSKLFVDKEPYERTDFLNTNDVSRMMLIRGMTFLGYTNDANSLSNEEIIAMGENEAIAIIRSIKDDIVKKTLPFITNESLTESTGIINDTPTSVIDKSNASVYNYDYIFSGPANGNVKVIPISGDFTNTTWVNSLTDLKEKAEKTLFLTNYSENTNDDKSNDGGIYVKILTKDEYNTNYTLYSAPDSVKIENTIRLNSIKDEQLDQAKVKEAGYNVFGGPLGIQDFNTMDFGEPSLEGLPLRFAFYNKNRVGLALTREASLTDTYKNQKFPYDYVSSGNISYSSKITDFQSTKNGILSHKDLGKNRVLFNKILKGENSDVTYPYVLQPSYSTISGNGDDTTYSDIDGGKDTSSFSLFGSKFYYIQEDSKIKLANNQLKGCSEYTKALLFLNTLPFVANGINMDGDVFDTSVGIDALTNDPDPIHYITHLFDIRGGFVHVPKVWCAYVGGLLWRLSESDPIYDFNGNIVGGGSGKDDIIIWKKNQNQDFGNIPRRDEYFPIIGDKLNQHPNISDNDLLKRLPSQVKQEFKRIFFEFVNGTNSSGISWGTIKNNLEIWDGTSAAFITYVDNARKDLNNNNLNNSDYFSSSKLSSLINKDKYSVIVPIKNPSSGGFAPKDTLWLELRDNTSTNPNPAVKSILDLLLEERIIANNNYRIWQPNIGTATRNTLSVTKVKFDIYFNSLFNKLKELGSDYSATNVKQDYEQKIFGTSNEDVIKLKLYRTCKNIHDKWLAGNTDSNNLFFRCGSRNEVDSELAKKYLKSDTPVQPKLIDSFRFVSRTFTDIGDLLYVNPLPINDFLVDNQNSSAYDSISSILNANNFEFIALPSFVNFKDDKQLESIFKPFGSFEEAIEGSVSGPSFVCVYAGQKSIHLDYKNSDYPNDSFDLRCGDDGNLDPSAPADFQSSGEAYEDPIAAFVVKYSQQNQNIFKDISLDQSEFTETDESIQIQEDISQKGAESNKTIAGQNLYNVYNVRSYKAEVEMMGNAMIQPMMYFQLDNIPMFHGAYMITRVKHNIKPNYMSTNFTGVRIRHAQTKLIDASEVFMSLIDTLDISAAGLGAVDPNSSGKPKSAVPPILRTLVENGSVMSNVVSGNITVTSVGDIPGIAYVLSPTTKMVTEAAICVKEMLKDWATWMSQNGFKKLNVGGKDCYAYVTSMYRPNTGNSMHSWGLAVDIQMFDKDGNIFSNNKANSATGKPFSFDSNPAIKWLYQNSYKYGFVQPLWANDGVGTGNSADEHWHWEYHGKAAICILKNKPIPGLGGNSLNDNPIDKISETLIKPFVKNPKGSDGVEVVYSDCEYQKINESDTRNNIETDIQGSDFWSLVSICALEAGFPQARCDVAQSIYNRFNTPKKPYGKTIRDVVLGKGQYEPTFKNRDEWLKIVDKETAITAVKNSKGITKDKAIQFIDETITALRDPNLQQISRDLIGTRTEFLAYHPKSKDATSVVHRQAPRVNTGNGGNNYFYWEYAGIALKGKTPSTYTPIQLS